ncbi:host specificity protein [Mesorhizobium sp. SARCC-RB16n]|uniref:host specificity protein n=1 Tax=Mesorhizobium sp. SARCC-RB16n TaxID=2116687 RepID=UPI001FEE1502|nr:host specificity protein [Mesorhizobium sp. SARCC-RB16n]
MYGRTNASSSRSLGPDHAEGSNRAADSDRFAENVAGVASDLPSSSSGEPRPYFLTSQPPIEEIDRSTFRREVRAFYGDDIKHIADNPQEYSGFVSLKALSAANVARGYASTSYDADEARYFSYKLGDKSVGLLKTDGGFSVPASRGRRFHAQFPGRTEITSQVALRVTHPLVENAGDILLEHQLRLDGERPLVMSRPASRGAEPRLRQMGFAPVGGDKWVLDPAQHPDKWNNDDGEWRRTDKPTLYLSKSGDDDRESSVETDSSVDTDSSGDDPSWYFNHLNIEPDGNIEQDRNFERDRARSRDDYTR